MSTSTTFETKSPQFLPPILQWEVETPQQLKIQTLSYCSADDLLRLATVCRQFSQLITQLPLWEGFAKTRGITLDIAPDASGKKHLFQLVKKFTSLFPEFKNLDAKSKHPLEDRLQSIVAFRRLNPDAIFKELKSSYDEKKISALMQFSPPNFKFIAQEMEKGSEIWKVYVRNGFPNSDVEIADLFEFAPQMQAFLGKEYFSLLFVQEIKKIRGEKFQFSNAIIKLAFEKGFIETAFYMLTEQQTTPALFKHALEHASPLQLKKICSNFLFLGYQFSREDLREFLRKDCSQKNSMSGLEFNELFKEILATLSFCGNSTDVKWAANPDSYKCFEACYGNYGLEVIRKMVDLLPNAPHSETFQYVLSQWFSIEIVDAFLKKGYQITSSDFRFVIDKLVAPKKEKSVPWESFSSDPKPNVLAQFIEPNEFHESYRIYEGGKFKPTPEDFRYMLEKRPQWFFINRVLKNGYKVESADFRKCIDHGGFTEIRELLKGDHHNNFAPDAYMPTQDDFQYALKKKDISWTVIEELISRGCKPTSDDFMLALECNCSAEVIRSLLNDGYILKDHYGNKYLEFEHNNAGFEPTEREFKRALELKCSKEIQELIIKRNKNSALSSS